ncbi:MAG: ImmA/IrrE family metallo-endopeptidase [Rhodocyclaceae bacterium]
MTTLFSNGEVRTPTGFKVAPQSYVTLEKMAEELRPLLPLLPGQQYKIDCCKVLENTLDRAGYQLKVEDVSTLEDCAAFTIPDMGLVVFREDIYDMLCAGHVFGRSTVIHETAHIVLRHAVTLHRGAPLGQHKFCEDSEWQAKALTAAVMMPIDACRHAGSAQALADMCGTSLQAAVYRLDRLMRAGLIERQLGWDWDAKNNTGR